MAPDIEALLKKQLETFYPLDEPAIAAFAPLWQEVSFKRKEIISPKGERELYLYLVLEGVQHAVCSNGDKEATLIFTYPHSFSGLIDSLLLQQPANYYLQAITHSRMLRIHYNQLMILLKQHRSIETWLWNALTQVLAGTLQRQTELLTYAADEKFTTLLKRSPQVLNMIPHKYLASYIGVDATTFSKMLGRIRIE